MTKLACALLITVLLFQYISFEETVIVNTKDGAVSGRIITTSTGRPLQVFLGIPYAKPPIGKFRFKEAQPVEKWHGIRPAYKWGSKCVQLVQEKVEGDEDCLYLNIITPSISNISKLDVIVFIHGGAFMFGSGEIEPRDSFITNSLDFTDIVYVSINYRLGPLGFLTTEDGFIPGNIGLKDQVLALKWVQQNIKFFGGDKNKVTITGMSAGGASVHYHYLSPLSKDLFSKGISASGSALCPWALQEKPQLKAKILAGALDCPTIDSERLLECMLSKDARIITSKVQQLFMPWHGNPISPFAPVVERNYSSAFISKNPYLLLAEGQVKDVPWLAGLTTEEGLCPAASFIANDKLLQELNDNWHTLAAHLLDYNYTVSDSKITNVSEIIRKQYIGDNLITKNNRNKLLSIFSDRMFLVSVEQAVRVQASVTKSKVFLYRFAYRGQYSLANLFCNCSDNLGVSHGDDITYLLKTPWSNDRLSTKEDLLMEMNMITIWKSFARFGVPKLPASTKTWPPVSSNSVKEENLSHVIITSSNNITLSSSGSLSNARFWSGLPIEEL